VIKFRCKKRLASDSWVNTCPCSASRSGCYDLRGCWAALCSGCIEKSERAADPRFSRNQLEEEQMWIFGTEMTTRDRQGRITGGKMNATSFVFCDAP
jgi:hypothetical protein